VDTAAVGTPDAFGTIIQRLAEAFRQAEKIEFDVNADAVRINGAQLIVALTGAYALQVPGVTYQVSFPAGFVQNNLNTPCPVVTAASPATVALGGVAKPFIRVNKTQDTITTATGSDTQPRLVAEQPFQAQVRMDCRTPETAIRYITTNAFTVVSSMNWTYNGANAGPDDLTVPAVPGRPDDPEITTINRQDYSGAFNIGDDAYQGLQWYVRAKANKGSDWSANSEEMAFRTVVTYVANGIAGGDTGIAMGDGDQIWIRGGDAVKSSTIQGFPLTWDTGEFSKVKDEKKRAGIRLFTRINNDAATLNNSTYKWITWDINTDAYFDIILGRDITSGAAEALQYGPRQYAYQRAGWTSFKEQCRILPGKHRWLVSNDPDPGKGDLNFSGTFGARPQYTGADITYSQ